MIDDGTLGSKEENLFVDDNDYLKPENSYDYDIHRSIGEEDKKKMKNRDEVLLKMLSSQSSEIKIQLLKIRRRLTTTRSVQTIIVARSSADYNSSINRQALVDNWASVQSGLLLITGMIQVYVIRRFHYRPNQSI